MRKLLVLLFFLPLTSSAFADSIDGDWCNAEKQRLTITGPNITLPSGKSLPGQYRRHEFAYQVPAGEPDAGQLIYMQLFDEYDMTSYIIKDSKPASPTQWTRCPVEPKTS